MERKKEWEKGCEKDSFVDWLIKMLNEHNVSQSKLAKETKIDLTYICKIVNRRIHATAKVQYLIINFFRHYGESYPLVELEKTPTTYGEWLSLETSNIEVAKYLGIEPVNFSKIKTGRIVPSTKKAELLFSFFEENGIDTSKGREKYKKLHRGTTKRISNKKQ